MQVEYSVNAQVEAQIHHSEPAEHRLGRTHDQVVQGSNLEITMEASTSTNKGSSKIVNSVEPPAVEFSVSVLAAEVDAGAGTSSVSFPLQDTSTCTPFTSPSPALSSPVGGLPIIKVRIHQVFMMRCLWRCYFVCLSCDRFLNAHIPFSVALFSL